MIHKIIVLMSFAFLAGCSSQVDFVCEKEPSAGFIDSGICYECPGKERIHTAEGEAGQACGTGYYVIPCGKVYGNETYNCKRIAR